MRFRGDNTFKIRAYENAAQAIRELEEPLDRAARRGPAALGAGDRRGDREEDRRLRRDRSGAAPPEAARRDPRSALLELLEVPGLGPKRARAAFVEAGIDSLDALEAAAMDGRLAAVSGFGPKSVEAIVAALGAGPAPRRPASRRRRARAGRDPRGVAPRAGRTSRGPRSRATCGGRSRSSTTPSSWPRPRTRAPSSRRSSTTRWRPRCFPAKASAGKRGEARRAGTSAACCGGGLPARLVVVSPEAFGAALVVRDRLGGARRGAARGRDGKKLRLEDDGLSPAARGTRPIPAPTRPHVYAALGLAWVPPELREGGGRSRRPRRARCRCWSSGGDLQRARPRPHDLERRARVGRGDRDARRGSSASSTSSSATTAGAPRSPAG